MYVYIYMRLVCVLICLIGDLVIYLAVHPAVTTIVMEKKSHLVIQITPLQFRSIYITKETLNFYPHKIIKIFLMKVAS